jgi:hypothetical protein
LTQPPHRRGETGNTDVNVLLILAAQVFFCLSAMYFQYQTSHILAHGPERFEPHTRGADSHSIHFGPAGSLYSLGPFGSTARICAAAR